MPTWQPGGTETQPLRSISEGPVCTGLRALRRAPLKSLLMTVIDFNFAKDALFLDLDGTLIDIAPRPEEVQAPESLIASLQAIFINLGGALAVISGRSIKAVDAVLYPLRLPAAGIHGAEISFDRDVGITHRGALVLPDALRWLLAPLTSVRGVLIEDKGPAIAVHYRQAPEAQSYVYEVVTAAVRANTEVALTIIPGKFVYEIKPRSFSKGTAVAEFMQRLPWAGRRPVFIGDDVTDESAFAELPRWNGLGLAVGGARPGAMARFINAAEVRGWLGELVQQEYTS
jgi:trehalose 6-phosphate phosphatase